MANVNIELWRDGRKVGSASVSDSDALKVGQMVIGALTGEGGDATVVVSQVPATALDRFRVRSVTVVPAALRTGVCSGKQASSG